MHICSMMPVVIATPETMESTLRFYQSIGYGLAHEYESSYVLTNRGHYILITCRAYTRLVLSIQVADIDLAYDEVKAHKDVEIVAEKSRSEGECNFIVKDPSGTMLLIQELT